MAKNKKQLNEFSLLTLLSPLAIYWFAKMFGRLLKDFQSWMDGRDVNITNALRKIISNLADDKSFLAKAYDIGEKYGITDAAIAKLQTTSEVNRELNRYKNDKNINFDELKNELRVVMARGIQNQSVQNGATTDLKRSLNR
jgi:hypothetical protein